MRLRLLIILAFLSAAIVLVSTADERAVAQPAPNGIEVVGAAYAILLDQFYAPLTPADLLASAWIGAGLFAAQNRLARPEPLPPLPDDRERAFALFAGAYERYAAGLPPGVDRVDLAFAVTDAMAEGVRENHTGFYTPNQNRAVLGSLGGSQVPVGLGLRRAGGPPWVVTAVAPGGPAERAGVKVGDVILAVDGRDATRAGAAELGRLLAGPEGSASMLTLQRDGSPVEATIVRGPFYFPPLTSRVLPGGAGYVRLESFVQWGVTLPSGTEILADLDRQLDALDAQGASGLILDLRGDSGGDTFTAAELLGRFLPEDASTVVRSDRRGHLSNGVVGGLMRRVQHPMVVLVDGGSASSSEVTASTLRESGRALLVGQRTRGSLATSQILPLPLGAGVQVAVAEQMTSRSRTRIDGNGVAPDIVEVERRTAADYRAGRDPQLEAAVAALARTFPPPEFASEPGPLSAATLRAMLSRYVPPREQIPTNDRLTRVVDAESGAFTHPNQVMNFVAIGARDPGDLRRTMRDRGWLGAYEQGFSVELLTPPSVFVLIDVYAGEDGARAALSTNDFPDVLTPVPALVALGEQAVSYRGAWLAEGSLLTSWRRGNVVFTVGYGDVPGYERTDVLVAVARLVDDAFLREPLPAAGEGARSAGVDHAAPVVAPSACGMTLPTRRFRRGRRRAATGRRQGRGASAWRTPGCQSGLSARQAPSGPKT